MSQAEVSVYRDPEGCNAPNDDCGSIGHIYFDVRASDDTTPTDQLGYRLRVRRGIGPGILGLDRDLLAPDGSIVLLFGVQGEPVDFDIDLGVTVIDLSGNLGQEQIVRITYSEDSGGCVTTRTPSPLSKLAIVCLTAGLLFRRRQRVA